MTNKPSYSDLEKQVFQLKEELDNLKQSESINEIREAQMLLKSSIESTKDMVILSIDKDYKYLFFNDTHKSSMKTVYGIDIQLGMNILDCITIDEDRQKAKNNYKLAISGTSHSIIEEYGGEPPYFYESFFNPIINDHNKITGATALALNVTNRVLAEKALSDSDTKYKAMMANIGDVIEIIDSDGCIKYTSSSIEKLFGLSPDELMGTYGLSNVHPEDFERVNTAFETIRDLDQASLVIEYRYRLINDTYKWVELKAVNNMKNPAINGILLSYHEISERKKAEQDLMESESRFRSLFENISSSSSLYQVILNDKGEPVDYLFLEVNAEYERSIGLKASDLVGKSLLAVFPGTESSWLDVFKNVYQTEKTVTLENYSKELDRHFELIVFIPKKGQLALIGNDITDRRKAEIKLRENQILLTKQNEELLVAKEKAEESDHLKTAFLQNMSHEIRTPMNAIYGFSEMLGELGLSVDTRKNYIQIIQESSNQLLSIVTDILTIASVETKQEKVYIHKVCVNNIVNELFLVFDELAAQQDISFNSKQELSDQDSEIYTDKTKLTQILTNLLSNALKFTHKGKVEFGYQLKENQLEFFVEDTGIGIKHPMQERIFERFRHADRNIEDNYGGTGLGLAISKGFVELLQGEIWVKSESNKGTSMFFTIPYKTVLEDEI
ncbi:PAS domain-containing sensor histidine kinase [bacterium]|nr:PAS domain-containing sensor histidine kinase [bacterium]